MWQTKGYAKLAHLVFKQLAQGLKQLEIQGIRQTTDVVMRLNRDRFACFGTRGFDHVRINRALREPFGLLKLACLGLEYLNKLATNNFTFCFGV
jgi:hypothetical protein